MILTGKCREYFEIFIECQTQIISMYSFRGMPESCKNALIIEFFDSSEIYIEIKNKFGQRKQRQRFSFVVKRNNSGFIFDSRAEAISSAITEANEIYNDLNKD